MERAFIIANPVPFIGGILSKGQVVRSMIHDEYGVVVNIEGPQDPRSCQSLAGGAVNIGGTAEIDVIWASGGLSPKLPESLLRTSVQWDIYGNILPQESIDKAWQMHHALAAENAKKAQAKQLAFATAVEHLKAEYPNLDTEEPKQSKRAAKNLRTLLKEQFPGIKFSVRVDSANAMHVAWADGPTSQQVKTLTSRFLIGQFDSSQDIYEYKHSPWNSLFGHVKYSDTRRTLSESLIEKVTEDLWQILAANLEGMNKPDPKAALSTMTEVPGLDFPVSEGVQELAAHFNAVSNHYENSNTFCRLAFLVTEALELNP